MNHLSTPVCLSHFFVKNCNVVEEDDDLIRYLDLSEVIGANLSDGYLDFISKDETFDGHLDVVLKMSPSNELKESDVVTWRGILTQIMCFPYSSYNDGMHVFNTILNGGTIYIEHDKSEMLERKSDPKLTYFGYRFETICMKNVKSGQRDSITSNAVEWTQIFASKLNNIRLLYGAEVDGIDEEKQETVELKTSKVIASKRDEYFFLEKKMMRSWAQSYLANVPNIIYGFRDNDGIVKQIARYKTRDIPAMVRGMVKWDSNVMLSFLHDFLVQVKNKLATRPGKVFKITLDPSRGRQYSIIETTESSFV